MSCPVRTRFHDPCIQILNISQAPFEAKLIITTDQPDIELNEPADLAAWTFNCPPGNFSISAGVIGGGTIFIELDQLPSTGSIDVPAENLAFIIPGDTPFGFCGGTYPFPL
jgi:hypothetical protein